jgi:hypothetical protein
MRFAAVMFGLLLAAGGCSRFTGEWLEEGKIVDGQYTPTDGPRRMALRFEHLATVRRGAYVDAAGVVEAKVVSDATYFTMKNDTVAQFGATIAKIENGKLITYIGNEESRRFVRVHGPSIFPPQVYVPSPEGG